ncbi:sensor histidine kinase [Amphibiibacter pelophylacis]|uniref:HAMP domain-containing sensor histidine kinase n=1 Tax=Amphibiibacter pelophylacis TaxID=1799477 RepID=A0ACC6NYH6_9BURK
MSPEQAAPRRWALSLSQRLSLVFVALLLLSSGLSAALQVQSSRRHEREVIQRVSYNLAGHIAGSAQLMDASGWRPQAIRSLFDSLMQVNPSVDVYLLDETGRIVDDASPEGRLKRRQIDMVPIRAFLRGGALPIVGDDPQHQTARKVFSVAPVKVNNRNAGFVYVVLRGASHDAADSQNNISDTLSQSLLTLGGVLLLALAMGLVAFRSITRPLRELTAAVRDFDAHGERAALLPRAGPGRQGDDIATLREAFVHMGERIAEQWRELTSQDQQRRQLISHISHDLRTPLTSIHGYLETLRLKGDRLDAAQRERYLDIALAQSQKMARLAEGLFELARLESGLVKPDPEVFGLPDLLQDVLQKCELTAESRQQTLAVSLERGLPMVRADVGMVERVLSNLLDNAIRHTPPGSRIEVRLHSSADRVWIDVADNGGGIDPKVRENLFTRSLTRPGPHTGAGSGSGGLGLIVVRSLLQINGGDIELLDGADDAPGTTFRCHLPVAPPSFRSSGLPYQTSGWPS